MLADSRGIRDKTPNVLQMWHSNIAVLGEEMCMVKVSVRDIICGVPGFVWCLKDASRGLRADPSDFMQCLFWFGPGFWRGSCIRITSLNNLNECQNGWDSSAGWLPVELHEYLCTDRFLQLYIIHDNQHSTKVDELHVYHGWRQMILNVESLANNERRLFPQAENLHFLQI